MAIRQSVQSFLSFLQAGLWQERSTPSLRTQVALIIVAFSFLPNLILFSLYIRTAPIAIDAWVWLNIILWLLLLMLICSWTGYILSRVVMRPLTHLAQDISHLQTPHQLADRPYDPSEARILRLALQDLLRQLRTEQQRRTAFLATLMHDLKTPLIAFQHLMRQLPNLPGAQQASVIEEMLSESDRLLNLVQKLVDAQRLEQGNIQLKPSLCNLHDLVQTLHQRCQPLAHKRQVQLSLSGMGWVNADAAELERALYNLIENALRYADREVHIQIDGSIIRVCDDGPGLPAPLVELIQPFHAAPIAIAGKHYAAGTGGLGLFIAQSIISAHGGRLSDHSQPGHTELWVELSAERDAGLPEV
ncbi:MAG: HAMP domain-containing histidine kinase [Synechococcaceae cyanobacterium SM2_3_60]|nr:HAMP domain-containing histidine kinase [Synechococcaceae cyanobacterium SM2_3_60]